MPTNSELSRKWPSLITPAGYAFAIWGIIFTLQGGGVMLALWPSKKGSPRSKAVVAVGPSWIATWAFENAWQLTFAKMANVSTDASMTHQLSVFLPCGALLWGGYLSSLYGCRRLANAEVEGAVGSSAGVIKLGTSLNAGVPPTRQCNQCRCVIQIEEDYPLIVPLALKDGRMAFCGALERL